MKLPSKGHPNGAKKYAGGGALSGGMNSIIRGIHWQPVPDRSQWLEKGSASREGGNCAKAEIRTQSEKGILSQRS